MQASLDAKSSLDGDGDGNKSSEAAGSVNSQRNQQKFRRLGRCEVISIDGAAGLGKTCLVQSIQVEARRRGYFALSKCKQPFRDTLSILSLISSYLRISNKFSLYVALSPIFPRKEADSYYS